VPQLLESRRILDKSPKLFIQVAAHQIKDGGLMISGTVFHA